MSTNYYVAGYTGESKDDPVAHIGKTYFGGVERGMGFIWAMEIGRLEGVTLIEDEYGKMLTRQDFTEILAHCTHQCFRSVGERFA